MSWRAPASLLALAAALAGCGLKGPLYLPEKSRDVVVRPAPGVPAEVATTPESPPEAKPEAVPEAPADRDAPPPPGTARG